MWGVWLPRSDCAEEGTCLINPLRVLDLAGQSEVGTWIMALRGCGEILAATCLGKLRLWGLVPATLVWKTKKRSGAGEWSRTSHPERHLLGLC